MDVLMDPLGELAPQTVGGVAKVFLAGFGVIATLVVALVVQVRKNKRSDLE